MTDQEKSKSIGALWLKTKADGEQFFSGVLENADGVKVSIIVFANTYKTEGKHPDYRIFRSVKQADVGPAPVKATVSATDEVPPPSDADAPPDLT